jgi:hypothetical protein
LNLAAGRVLLVCGTLLVLAGIARGEGNYQRTRDGKTLVWNNHPKRGDVATWSGARDRDGYAHGFGQLVWYTKERGFVRPQFYARYWGRMVDGKFEGPVNAHARRKTHYAIFIEGARVTSWAAGSAPSRANARWRALVAKRRPTVEPEAPAAGPGEQISELRSRRSEDGEQKTEDSDSIQDLWSERWPKIDIDESLRVLALPPRSLRVR